MREKTHIPLLCPVCKTPLEKQHYKSKGNWVTHWRIHCTNKQCKVDTGEQPTMSDAYESLCVFYFGAQTNHVYKHVMEED